MGTELLPDSEKECWCLTMRESILSRDPSLDLDSIIEMVNAASSGMLREECGW